MAKKERKTSAPKSASSGAGGKATQAKLRKLDSQILGLINDRARVAAELQTGREREMLTESFLVEEASLLDRLEEVNEGPLDGEAVRAVFREILGGCRSLGGRLRVAMLGPWFSYSHLAAIERFGSTADFLPVGNIAAVFEEVQRGHANYGIVPIENSTDGRVIDTLDMFTQMSVRICGEVELAIHHMLLGIGGRDEIREVQSKPQALSQCRNWLARHLPQAVLKEVTSTSAAAAAAKESPHIAAIASRQAGNAHGLKILAENIEDNSGNITRFSVIATQSAPRTGKDKTAIIFQLDHRPGTLAEALNLFKRNRINLTWIESLPIPNSDRAYLFFVELEGHETDLKIRRVVQLLENKALQLKILGSYPSLFPAAGRRLES